MPSVEEVRSKVTARVWQSIAQSGVEVSSIPTEQLQTLVNSIADGVLVAVNEALAGVSEPQEVSTATEESNEEVILWEGRPFLSLIETYMLTTDRLRITHGLLTKDREDIELVRVEDVDHTQNLSERVLNLGDIVVRSHDPSAPEVILRNVTNPMEVHEMIRRAVLDARKRHRLTFQEEM